jgi:hypothetical protein
MGNTNKSIERRIRKMNIIKLFEEFKNNFVGEIVTINRYGKTINYEIIATPEIRDNRSENRFFIDVFIQLEHLNRKIKVKDIHQDIDPYGEEMWDDDEKMWDDDEEIFISEPDNHMIIILYDYLYRFHEKDDIPFEKSGHVTSYTIIVGKKGGYCTATVKNMDLIYGIIDSFNIKYDKEKIRYNYE